ncbi:MAG: hypothetical protein QF752_08335 [Planctomycetota bacterium]|jgi:hypothetical protein|nr:hypothetical protein [Planctomycetota bacterium]
MFFPKIHLSLLVPIVFLAFAASTTAQNLNPQQKLQYLAAVNQSAQEELGKGKVDRSKLILLSALSFGGQLIQNANNPQIAQHPQFGPVLRSYVALCNKAWASGPPSTMPQVQAFMKAHHDNRARLGTLTKFYDWDNDLPNGKKDYYKKISQMIAQREVAWGEGDALAKVAPNPLALCQNQALFMKLHSARILQTFYRITFGPAIAMMHAQQRVVPEVLRMAEDLLNKAKSQNQARDIWRWTAEAERMVQILSTIESSTREEKAVDFSALAAKLPSLSQTIESENKRAAKRWNAEVDAARVPEEKWNSSERDALGAQIKKAFSQSFEDEEVMRVVVMSADWGERWESWWDNNVLLTQYFGYVKAAVVSKQTSGDHRVFVKWFRRDRNADGGWGPIYYHKNLYSYLIRPENIQK